MSKLDALTSERLELWPDAALLADPHGTIVDANGRLGELFGYDPIELVGHPVEMLLPPRLRESHQWYRSRYEKDPVKRPMGAGLDLVGARADGTEIAVDISLSPVDTDEGVYVIAAVRDVSDQRAATNLLRRSEERFRSIFEDNPVGMATVDAAWRITAANAALRAMLGCETVQLVGKTFDDLAVAGDQPDASGRPDGDRKLQRADGDHLWGRITTATIDTAGRATELVVMVQDVTEEIADQLRLAHLATHDQLTQLPNRSLLLDHLHQALVRSERSGTDVGVLYIDLDNFKHLNDTFGHPAGDRVLIEVAQRIAATIRPSDTAARVGGDEFIVCCDDLPHREGESSLAHAVAWRLRVELNEPMEINATSVELGASIGVAVGSGIDRTADSLIWEADTAMFREKATHRHR